MFYAVAITAVVLTGISKSGLGGGIGQLTVPLMAMFISPIAAAAIMMPVLVFMDLLSIWSYRKDWDKRNIFIMVPGAVIGVSIGGLTYHYVDENTVRLLLGILTLIFVATYFLQRTPVAAKSNRSRVLGAACGALSGFTSFVAHAGGAPMKFYILPQMLDKRTFVGTHVVFFFIVNQLKIWPYLWLGQFTPENLSTSLVLAPAVPLGVWLGLRLNKVLPIELFYRICYVLLLIAGIKLVWDGLGL